MRPYGRASLHDFLGDFVVYRNLDPVDERLPGLQQVMGRAGIRDGVTPRKNQWPYARVIVQLLQAARVLEGPRTPIRRVVYVGDTRMNDGTAFANIARAGGWPGMAFIAAERGTAAAPEVVEVGGGPAPRMALYLASHWSAIAEPNHGPSFEEVCRSRGFSIDGGTAVVIDLDKAALGARGRNDHVIDRARVEAVRRTVGGLLGKAFDEDLFQEAYDTLNVAEFHSFTADNQDYLAYICLMLGSGLYELGMLVAQVRAEQLSSFEQFIGKVDQQAHRLPDPLRDMHRRIYRHTRAGDPTPFKTFRYNEYRSTVARMGCLDDGAPVEQLLAEEILITHEVREAALRWRARGALLFGLSDKPDEASIPTRELARRGCQAIHRVETHAVGRG